MTNPVFRFTEIPKTCIATYKSHHTNLVNLLSSTSGGYNTYVSRQTQPLLAATLPEYV